MFGWFKNKKVTDGTQQLLVDVLSHIIPAIDDGVQSLEDSLAILRKFESLGYKKLITTPHVMSDTFRNTTEGMIAKPNIHLQLSNRSGSPK